MEEPNKNNRLHLKIKHMDFPGWGKRAPIYASNPDNESAIIIAKMARKLNQILAVKNSNHLPENSKVQNHKFQTEISKSDTII